MRKSSTDKADPPESSPSRSGRRGRKAATRSRILDVAARRIRERGLHGVGVSEIMGEAGLTHGGFYVHFPSKRALLTEALGEAASTSRRRYFSGLRGRSGADWIRAAVRRYLSPAHRDEPGSGCPFASLSGDLAHASGSEARALRERFEAELQESAATFRAHLTEADHAAPSDRALATLALCAGGLSLARSVADPKLSGRILRACRELAVADLDPNPGDPQ